MKWQFQSLWWRKTESLNLFLPLKPTKMVGDTKVWLSMDVSMARESLSMRTVPIIKDSSRKTRWTVRAYSITKWGSPHSKENGKTTSFMGMAYFIIKILSNWIKCSISGILMTWMISGSSTKGSSYWTTNQGKEDYFWVMERFSKDNSLRIILTGMAVLQGKMESWLRAFGKKICWRPSIRSKNNFDIAFNNITTTTIKK